MAITLIVDPFEEIKIDISDDSIKSEFEEERFECSVDAFNYNYLIEEEETSNFTSEDNVVRIIE